MPHDLFISHASEDKEGFVEPLVAALRDRGLSVWYDRFELTLGDDLRRKIDEGLRECRFGVVVLSPAFLGKRWPEDELSALFALEQDGRKRVLPVRYQLSHADLTARAPLIGRKLNVGSEAGMEHIVDAVLAAVRRTGGPTPVAASPPSRRSFPQPDGDKGSLRRFSQATELRTSETDDGLDARMTFESFVVGTCNEFAHRASVAVAEAPGTRYSPLIIYGPSGLGKTHLATAIGIRALAKRPQAVVFLTAAGFMRRLRSANKVRELGVLRDHWCSTIDVLILDDVQFLAGRGRPEEELYHVFEALQARKKQVVVTADRPPQEIGNLEPRLRTRFAGGLMADVQPPDIETMTAIVAKKGESLRMELPHEVVLLLAEHANGSVREVEGLLTRLSASQAFYREEISVEFVWRCMGQLLLRGQT